MNTLLRLLERLSGLQHLALALASVWLLASSPWLGMRRILPADPTFWDLAHVGVGLAAGALAVTYTLTQTAGGRWRTRFPWLTGRVAGMGRDLAGLARGRIPASDGEGLFPALKGLVLIFLLATVATGLGWLISDGSRAALDWRSWHLMLANVFGWLLLAHVVAGFAHLLEFLRD